MQPTDDDFDQERGKLLAFKQALLERAKELAAERKNFRAAEARFMAAVKKFKDHCLSSDVAKCSARLSLERLLPAMMELLAEADPKTFSHDLEAGLFVLRQKLTEVLSESGGIDPDLLGLNPEFSLKSFKIKGVMATHARLVREVEEQEPNELKKMPMIKALEHMLNKEMAAISAQP